MGDSGEVSVRRASRFLKICLLVPLTVFCIFSLRHEVKLDWTGGPWVAAIPLLALGITRSYLQDTPPPGRRWLKAAWPLTLAALLLIYGFGLCYLVTGIPGVADSVHTELVPIAWRDFGRQVETVADEVRRQDDVAVLVVGMDRYAIASEVAFYAHDRARSVASSCSAHLFGAMGLMYERWFPASAQAGRTLLLVAWDAETLQDPQVAAQVDRLDPVHEGLLTRHERTIRRYYYRVAHGYRPAIVEAMEPR